jgi:hypothetical protein
MIRLSRLVNVAASSVAVLMSVAACGSDASTSDGQPTTTAPASSVNGTGFPPNGAAGGGALTAGATTTATTPVAPLPAAPLPAAPVTPVVPAAALPVAPAAPVPAAPVPAAPGAPAVPDPGAAPGDTWTAMSNLDANGVLIPPAAGAGFQIVTTQFDLQPGQEVYKCYHAAVPTTAVFPVGEWDGQMSAGSHHFILYRTDGDTVPDGTLADSGCTQGFGGSTWLYTQGTPRSHLLFPQAVAMELTTKERITFDMHYINTTSNLIHAKVALNVNKVLAETYQKADAQISFNIGIAVPPHGMQTVQGDCQPVPGANYFLMQTHTHKHATLAEVTRKLANGMMGESLVQTTNWDMPQAHVWQAAPFLTFASGEMFHYSCSYQNDSDITVTVGTSADTNEMCMAEAYFYPASGTTPSCN